MVPSVILMLLMALFTGASAVLTSLFGQLQREVVTSSAEVANRKLLHNDHLIGLLAVNLSSATAYFKAAVELLQICEHEFILRSSYLTWISKIASRTSKMPHRQRNDDRGQRMWRLIFLIFCSFYNWAISHDIQTHMKQFVMSLITLYVGTAAFNQSSIIMTQKKHLKLEHGKNITT